MENNTYKMAEIDNKKVFNSPTNKISSNSLQPAQMGLGTPVVAINKMSVDAKLQQLHRHSNINPANAKFEGR